LLVLAEGKAARIDFGAQGQYDAQATSVESSAADAGDGGVFQVEIVKAGSEGGILQIHHYLHRVPGVQRVLWWGVKVEDQAGVIRCTVAAHALYIGSHGG